MIGLLDNSVLMGLGWTAVVNGTSKCRSVVAITHLSSLPSLSPTSWTNRTAGTAHNKLWYAALSLVTLIMYSIATGGLILMAVFYTQKDGCMENKILLGVNGGLCVLISLVAISPCVQNRKHNFFPFFLIYSINVF